MSLMSYSNSCCSISASICSSACSILCVKSRSYDCSPSLPDASCSHDSITCTCIFSYVCTSCAPCCTYSYCASFSYLCNSCSFWNFSFNSCNSFYFLHSLFLSLPLCVPLVALFPLFLYFQSYFLQKWVYSKLAAFLFLHVVDNIPLALVAH